VGQGGHDPGEHVEAGVPDGAQAVLDVVAEDPQEQHVAGQVQQRPVQEHRDHDRDPHPLAREHLGDARLALADARLLVAELQGAGDLLGVERLAGDDLTRDGGVLVDEADVTGRFVGRSRLLQQEVDGHVGDDQSQRDHREPASRVLVAQRQHARRRLPSEGANYCKHWAAAIPSPQ
jgi:hypothetical protein